MVGFLNVYDILFAMKSRVRKLPSPYKKSGFTLVELSIVLVIIGLLIGGILVAQGLIESAKSHTYIRELEAIKFSYDEFRQRFNQKPGDFSRRVAMLGGASDGDGDGNIEWNSDEVGNFWEDLRDTTYKDIEQHYYIIGYYALRDEDQTSANNSDFYYAKTGVLYGNPLNDGLAPSNEDILALAEYQSGACNAACPSINSNTLSAVDGKIDDSLPTTGKIRGNRAYTKGAGALTTCSYTPSGTAIYKPDEEGKNCRLIYLIERY